MGADKTALAISLFPSLCTAFQFVTEIHNGIDLIYVHGVSFPPYKARRLAVWRGGLTCEQGVRRHKRTAGHFDSRLDAVLHHDLIDAALFLHLPELCRNGVLVFDGNGLRFPDAGGVDIAGDLAKAVLLHDGQIPRPDVIEAVLRRLRLSGEPLGLGLDCLGAFRLDADKLAESVDLVGFLPCKLIEVLLKVELLLLCQLFVGD